MHQIRKYRLDRQGIHQKIQNVKTGDTPEDTDWIDRGYTRGYRLDRQGIHQRIQTG